MSIDLSHLFSSVAFKILRAVDLPNLGSNQHEINGAASLREFFQTGNSLKGKLQWFYFEDGAAPEKSESDFTFYDARARSVERTGRSEWRLYYSGSFLSKASADDVLVLAKDRNDVIFALAFEQDSNWLQAARVLFGFDPPRDQFQILTNSTLEYQTLEFTRQRIIEALGIEIVIPTTEADRDLVLRTFGESFPDTKTMSEFARSITSLNPRDDADLTLAAWIAREEELFRAIEDIIVSKKLNEGFADVDDFIKYSLSVQNRRKSRMGYALMHHLAAVFDIYGLQYEREAVTERKNKPDFLFPGKSEYDDPNYSASRLVMLGAKSSLKDRWRQILTEADRIPEKHLCTLEAGISRNQTEEMQRQHLTLIIPSGLHETYLPEQRTLLLTLHQFIEIVANTQLKSSGDRS
ncbi:MAG: restriction endonuclease [Anaerolineae bacterium]|nr:restriction endonuclease [Anaerolineae bacterium]